MHVTKGDFLNARDKIWACTGRPSDAKASMIDRVVIGP